MKQTAGQSREQHRVGQSLDPWLIAGIAMLIIWVFAVLRLDAPGWIHGLLTVGVFVVIWRIVVRGTRGEIEK